jgi:membrane protease subunit (stomatin/prohibitin family)
MGLWDKLRGHAGAQFLDVIEWLEDDRKTILYKYPAFNQAIQDNSKLVVREGQSGVFQAEGKISDSFGPGTYDLNTRTQAIWSFFESIKYGLNYPYKGDIFFVSTRQFTDQKWGTPGPIPMEDAKFGMVNVRAFGNFSYRISDPVLFIREIVGNMGQFTTDEINGQLKRKLSSAFIDTLGEAQIPLIKLASQYLDLGDAMRDRMSPTFEQSFGIKITDFVVERVSMPEEVQKMMNKVTGMNMVGDIGRYSQFQAANAIETMASREGGGAGNSMMDAGMGMAMGNMMGNAMGGGMGGGGAQHAPPPPPSSAFHYNGAAGQGQFSASDIAQKIAANRNAAHNIWAPGWSGWKPWREVPEISTLVPPEQAAPPAPPSPVAESFHYIGGDGQQVELSVSEVAQRVSADPAGKHLLWKAGFSGWLPANEVPAVQAAMQASAPPPPPPGPGAPPPPPAD